VKTLVVTALAALALGLGAGTASAAVDKSGIRAQVPDGMVQGEREEDSGRRWMRSWRDQESAEARPERSWGRDGSERVDGVLRRNERAPTARSWGQDDSDGAPRRPKPRD
jgi:hypothetical protein